MNPLNKLQKMKLKSIVQSDKWEMILEFAEVIKEKWSQEPVKANDEFNTIWNTAQREAKINALVEFLKTMETESDI